MDSSKLHNLEQNLEGGKQYPIPTLGTGTSVVTGGCSAICASTFNTSEALHLPGYLVDVQGFQSTLGMTRADLGSCSDVLYVYLT